MDVSAAPLPAGSTRNSNSVWYSTGSTGIASDIAYIIYTNAAKTTGVYLRVGDSAWRSYP